jgi:dTDP-4-dehydrorhamnose reductase
MPCKVLVTGAKGQLALTIRELYFKNTDDIEFTFVDKNQLDITKAQEVETFFDNYSFDYCINCAAYTNVEKAEIEIETVNEVNSKATKSLAKECSKRNITLIHISTDYVFDGEKTTPYLESDLTQPINKYGESKLKGEKYIEEICTQYFILRTSWLYSKFGNNFLKTIISKIKENKELNIINTQIGSPTSTVTVAEFCYFLIYNNEKVFGTYHVTSSGQTSWFGFAKEIAKYFSNYDSKQISPVSSFKTKAKRPSYSVLSNYKALNLYQNILDWKEDLKRVITSI